MDTIKYIEKELMVFETNDLYLKLIQQNEFDKNQLKYGIYRYGNGFYKGYFKNGKRHGAGSMTYKSGDKDEGEREHGPRNGRG